MEIIIKKSNIQPNYDNIEFRIPIMGDGNLIHNLIFLCPPLDRNSIYCNLLQCSHFSATSIIAEEESRLVGWISGYRPPTADCQLFVWQVAVHPEARGKGLALRMLNALVTRPALDGITGLATSITPENAASWALFRAFARHHQAEFNHRPWLDHDLHFSGKHESEYLVTITPRTGRFGAICESDHDNHSTTPDCVQA